MANVFFKQGTQTNYDGLSSRDAGTFYVTTDTHKLYLGDNLLSQAVRVVTALPSFETEAARKDAEGTIYYLQNSNVLAVYNYNPTTKTGEWVQLNPDTYISGVSSVTAVADNTATVTTQVAENRGDHTTANPFQTQLAIKGSNGNTITASGNTITVAAPELTASAVTGGAKLTLDDTNISIVGGTNSTVALDATTNTITVDSQFSDTETTAGALTAAKAASSGNGFTLGGQLTNTVTAKDGTTTTKTVTLTSANLDPQISVKNVNGASNTAVHFKDGKIDLDVYDTAAVDSKIQTAYDAVNSMTYKGTVGSADGATVTALPTTGVKIGDTYITNSTFTVNTVEYPVGTLLIASAASGASEGSDGTLATADVVWNGVKTSDSDTTYSIVQGITSGHTNAIGLKASTDKSSLTAEIEFVGDDHIGAVVSNAGKLVTITHKDVTRSDATKVTASQTKGGNTDKILAVTQVDTDDEGHVTKVYTTETTLVDTVTTLTGLTQTVATSNTAATSDAAAQTGVKITTQASASEGTAKSDDFTLTSESLTITAASADKVKMELTWGTF